MSTICLKVDAFAGTTIEDTCRDLCALADRVGILCEAGFNGVKLWAYPGSDPAQLAKAWGEQMKRPEHIYRIASARPARGPAAPAPLNGIPATDFHGEGAIARCSYCGRYSLDRKTLGEDRYQPVCECGEKHGWSGSFKKPGPDAKWSGKAPAGVQASGELQQGNDRG